MPGMANDVEMVAPAAITAVRLHAGAATIATRATGAKGTGAKSFGG